MPTRVGLQTQQNQQQSVKNECGKVTYCHLEGASHASRQSYNETTENSFILMEKQNKDVKLSPLIFALCSSQARAAPPPPSGTPAHYSSDLYPFTLTVIIAIK